MCVMLRVKLMTSQFYDVTNAIFSNANLWKAKILLHKGILQIMKWMTLKTSFNKSHNHEMTVTGI